MSADVSCMTNPTPHPAPVDALDRRRSVLTTTPPPRPAPRAGHLTPVADTGQGEPEATERPSVLVRGLQDALRSARLKITLGDAFGAGAALERAERLAAQLACGLVAALLLAVGVAATAPAPAAAASMKPTTAAAAGPVVRPSIPQQVHAYPMPCRRCVYYSSNSCDINHPNGHWERLYGFVEHVVFSDGRDHVRKVEFIGYNEHGAHVWDQVDVRVGIPDGPWVLEELTFTPLYRAYGKLVIGGRNGRTVRGLQAEFTGHYRGRSCTVTVLPDDTPPVLPPDTAAVGPFAALAAARAR